MRSTFIPISSAHVTHTYAQPQQQEQSYSACQHAARNLGRLNLVDQIRVEEDIDGTHFHYEPEKNRHFIKATVDEDNVLSFGVRAKELLSILVFRVAHQAAIRLLCSVNSVTSFPSRN